MSLRIPRSDSAGVSLGDLALVLVLALGIRLLWTVLVPPWLNLDEPAHFTYVAHLVEQHEIPHQPLPNNPYGDYSHEVRQSFLLTHYRHISQRGKRIRPELAYLPVKDSYATIRAYNAPPEQRRSAAGSTATPYPPLYYAIVSLGYRAFFDSPLLARLFATRAVSALLGALTCCFCYLFAHELRRDAKLSLAAGLGMAFLPMHSVMSAAVNNDAGLFLSSGVLCWLSARTLMVQQVTRGLAAGLGIASSVMMLMKPTGAPLVLVAVGLLLWRVLRDASQTRGSRASLLVAYVLPVATIYGSWVIYRATSPAFAGPQAYSQEGDFISNLLHGQHSPWSYLKYQWNGGMRGIYRVFVSQVLGVFGWREITLPRPILLLGSLGYVGTALGMALHLRREPSERAKSVLCMALIGMQVVFIFLVADYALSFARVGAGLGVQGRYFFPAAAPMFFLVLLGWYELCGRRRWLFTLLPMAIFLIHLVSVRTILAKWYGVKLG